MQLTVHLQHLLPSETFCSFQQQHVYSYRFWGFSRPSVLALHVSVSPFVRWQSQSSFPSSDCRNPKHSMLSAQFDRKLRVRALHVPTRRDQAPTALAAANGHHGQAMLLSSDDDDEGKLHSPTDQKLLLHTDSKVLTLPTVLTLARVAAIPVLLVVFYVNKWWATPAATCIFIMAALTDWLDGFLARKMGSTSTFGAFLDPVADKLMVATTLVLLSTKPLNTSWGASIPWLIPLPAVAIIGREIMMSAVREWAASQGGDIQAAVAVSKLGKWKTAAQMIALTILLLTRNESGTGMACLLVAAGVSLLYFSAALALWSLFMYMKGIWRWLSR